MAWEKGRYYTRSRRRNGRVVREYIGTGSVAVLAAQLDAVERVKRAQERKARRARQAALEALDAPLRELDDRLNIVTEAVFLAAGYRRHHRGEWRKQRGQPIDQDE